MAAAFSNKCFTIKMLLNYYEVYFPNVKLSMQCECSSSLLDKMFELIISPKRSVAVVRQWSWCNHELDDDDGERARESIRGHMHDDDFHVFMMLFYTLLFNVENVKNSNWIATSNSSFKRASARKKGYDEIYSNVLCLHDVERDDIQFLVANF